MIKIQGIHVEGRTLSMGTEIPEYDVSEPDCLLKELSTYENIEDLYEEFRDYIDEVEEYIREVNGYVNEITPMPVDIDIIIIKNGITNPTAANAPVPISAIVSFVKNS